MNVSFEEIKHRVIPVSDIRSVTISGLAMKRVKIKTQDETLKLEFNHIALSNRSLQLDLLNLHSSIQN